MNQFTKTTMVALAIVAGITSGALAQLKSIRLDPVSKDLYRLTYLNEGACQIQVEVIDERGVKLFSERVRKHKSFTQPYSFRNLQLGEYSFRVIDADGEYITKIKRTDDVYIAAQIKNIDDEKAKIIVRGKLMSPVSVNIFDSNDVKVYDDFIDRERGFSKVYNLSKVKADELRIEVVAENRTLATAKF